MIALRQWFLARTVRERWLLALMAAIALPLLAYLLVYQPLAQRLEAAKTRHVQAVQRHGAVLAQLALLEGTSAPVAGAGGAPLALRVTDAASRAGIRLSANEPRGPATTVVTVAPAPPTASLRWLRELEASGIRIQDLSVTPQGQGAVIVNATLSGGAAS